MERIFWIGLFGALGALSRYGVQVWVTDLAGRPTVLGTFIVNISGSFVLGLFFAFSEQRDLLSPPLRSAVTVGFLGAYTTFSTLMLEAVGRAEAGNSVGVLVYLGGSIFIGLVVAYAGLSLGRALA